MEQLTQKLLALEDRNGNITRLGFRGKAIQRNMNIIDKVA
jgi:hypothetical protein